MLVTRWSNCLCYFSGLKSLVRKLFWKYFKIDLKWWPGFLLLFLIGIGGHFLFLSSNVFFNWLFQYFVFSSVAQSGPTLCDPMDCSTSGLPVHHQLLELVQTHVHRVSDAIQPSHPLPSPSPPAFSLSFNGVLGKNPLLAPHKLGKERNWDLLEYYILKILAPWTLYSSVNFDQYMQLCDHITL